MLIQADCRLLECNRFLFRLLFFSSFLLSAGCGTVGGVMSDAAAVVSGTTELVSDTVNLVTGREPEPELASLPPPTPSLPPPAAPTTVRHFS